MRRLTIGGVPIHPALVHLPIAAWSLAPAMDAIYLVRGGEVYWQLGWWSAAVGALAALPAMAAGALDAVAGSRVTAAADTVWRHAGLMALAWSLFVLACVLTPPAGPPRTPVVGPGLHLLGALAMAAGAHAGGRLAYVHRLPEGRDAGAAPDAR